MKNVNSINYCVGGWHRLLTVCLACGVVDCAAQAVLPPPVGYANGLDCAFYAWSGSISRVPDVSALTPVATGTVEAIDYPATTEAWPGAPTNLTDRFVSSFSGYLYALESAAYEFTLKSDDGAIVWIDGEEAVNHDGSHGFTSRTASVPLSIGLHTFEVRHYDRTGNAGLQVSWSLDGAAAEIISGEYLFHANGVDPDTDGDSLPDWWEEIYGYDPLVADDASLDIDNDGLTTYEECLHGASPFSGDTDSDGMPDAWEVVHGQHPAVADTSADKDGDGLAAIEEYRAGTDPRLADTDGDGIGDYVEVMELGSCPNGVDAITLGLASDASATEDGSFTFAVATPGIFAFDAEIAQRWVAYGKGEDAPRTTTNHAKFFVDGHYVSYREIAYDVSNAVHLVFYTPVLSQGTHTLRVALRHPDYRVRAFVSFAAIHPVSGVEAHEAAWRRNSIPSDSLSSRVSPTFIEGTARFPWLAHSALCEVRRGAADTWYADVPLQSLSPVNLDITFESVASTNIVVSWEETNLFDGAEDILIRRGSSLLFAGLPQGETDGVVAVFTNGVAACEYEDSGYATLLFDCDGEYEIAAIWTDGEGKEVESSAITVDCIGGSLPEVAPACVVGTTRVWDCPGVATNCVMETDLRTHVAYLTNTTWTLLADDTRGDRVVTARIAAGGPILGSTRLNPLWAVDSYGDACYIAMTNDTRTLCMTCLVQGWAPDDVDFRVRPYSSSVTFYDLAIEKWFSASDFDSDGCKWFYMSIPRAMSSPCHLVHIYQDGVPIGEAIYVDSAMPPELK